jgi:predicted AAA+ superfamily ATPase
VDFIARQEDRSRMLVQVCESLADPQTRKREIAALAEAMVELNLAAGIIVTRGEEGIIEDGAGKITIVPAWRFLLDLEQRQGV